MRRKRVAPPEPVYGWLFALVVAVGLAAVPLPAWVVDQFYSRGFYPTVQTWFTTATNLIPFALIDLLLIAVIFLGARRLVRLLSTARHAGFLDAGWEAFRRVVRLSAGFTVLFMIVWGLNYRRVPLDAELSGGPPPVPSVEGLEAVISDANVLASRLRGAAVKANLGFDEVHDALEQPLNAALADLGRTPLSAAARPKYSLVLTPFFVTTGVDGMVDPVALEMIVNPDLLPFERPYVLAHEWAHLAGMADEAEASAVGWLACMKGPPPLAYSATLYLIMEARAALPAERRGAVNARLDAGVRSDLDVIADRLQRENPRMQRAASRIYDEYLRVNRIGDGLAVDGRGLQLILHPRVFDAMSNYAYGRKAD
jgi:hypothetical protein